MRNACDNKEGDRCKSVQRIAMCISVIQLTGNSVVDLTLDFMRKLESERSLPMRGIFGCLDILLTNKTQVHKTHYLAQWHKLQHALKRLLSLHDTIEVFAARAKEWPQLFKDATVHFLRSKKPKAYKFNEDVHLNSFLQSLRFDAETTRKTKSRGVLEKELNKCIQGIPGRKNKRQVHAEIQLWTYITKMRSSSGFVPFRPGRAHTTEDAATRRIVIGVSKLTCRLCHWFFQGIGPDPVVIRPSSLNVYHRWALPYLPPDSEITTRLYDELGHESSSLLGGRNAHRTETDTDSEPNTPGIFMFSGESSKTPSELSTSGIWSDADLSTSSIESGPELGKVE